MRFFFGAETITKVYYRKEAMTRQVLTEDGWFHTRGCQVI